ncbi:tetratricopeptide repeat protein [Yoonia litorea]|uniref:Flp pilus assembly protein TadD, contains TPR repeats n=1 Tax=Yoonia litorea TaxID=1123755 RepID=A0A1I6N2F8_9RHOB|nr:tetratricopeptide repeat protein [Yoonia litorea]SFS22139.1 Flp pilus assembly protein TadD, contains TPR repeats [Yoonia litorea]
MRKYVTTILTLTALAVASAPAVAEVDTGAYLAGKQAETAHDFGTAARYFADGLVQDPTNADLLDRLQRAYVAQGDFARAVPVARTMADAGVGNPVTHLILRTDDFAAGRWNEVLNALEAGQQIGPLVDQLSAAWALVGAGDTSAAMDAFDAVIQGEGMGVYGLTHKAYALAAFGDFEGAQRLFTNNGHGGMRYSRQSAIAHAQIMSQLGQNTEALELISAVFGTQLDPGLIALRDALSDGEAVAYSAVRTPAEAMGDLAHVIAGLVQADAPANFTLLYTRAANHLWPQNATAQLMTARLLEELENYDLANAAYSAVSPDDPSYHAAELGRAEALRAAGREEAAVEVLEGLTRLYPALPEVHATKGDTLRMAERYAEADRAYTRALDLYDNLDRSKWFVYYTRAITRHRLDDWTGAEADFRSALALRPEQPQVLNYLGYSLVERGEKLSEALDMIETAAAARPDHGAIIDSLGWVYFQLGRYDEAVVHLEHAASLEPVDAVINDHLGDAFWAVGREIEARFQWQRALSFSPSEEDATRIRAKLDRGLDAVLEEEGAEPLQVARDDS